VYTVPWFVDAGVLYYRTDLLAKYNLSPPQTFAELTRAAHLVLQGEKNPRLTGFVWQGKRYEGLGCVALEGIRAYGGGGLDGRGAGGSAGVGRRFSLIRPPWAGLRRCVPLSCRSGSPRPG